MVGGWLPHLPLSSGSRTSPAAWLVRTPKSVRPQRARCAVCVFVDGNSHNEAEVSKILDWVQSERASSHRRSSPTGAVGAVLSPKRKPTQNLPKEQSQEATRANPSSIGKGTHTSPRSANALARLAANKRQTGRRDCTDSAKEPTRSAASPLIQRFRTRRRLTFPVWLVRCANDSGQRGRATWAHTPPRGIARCVGASVSVRRARRVVRRAVGNAPRAPGILAKRPFL